MQLQMHGRTRGLPNRVIREAMRFYAQALSLKPKVKISLYFTNKIPSLTGAEMWQRSPNKHHYTIRCSSKNGPYRTLQDLAHEILHVEQFLSGAMAENRKGTEWKGRTYKGDFMDNDNDYWNAPWEIDANGRQYWLYKRCRLHMRKLGIKLRK